MSPHFNLLNVLRRTPKDVLKLYALRRGILTSFDWGERNAVDADRLAKALKAEGEKVYHNTVIEFRRLWNLQGLEFTQGAFNEARSIEMIPPSAPFKRSRATLPRHSGPSSNGQR